MSRRVAVIYCRVSSLEQVDGTSLESQERICREYAQQQNIEVAEVFIDRGESAKTAARPEFLNAISYCGKKKNEVSFFIVYKLDRFARSQQDHITVRAKLKQYGVQLRSVTEPIDDTPTGKLMESILASFAEFDNNIRTERSSNGMRERLKQGLWVWSCPIGYKRLEKGGVIVPDDNARFVRIAFEEYATGVHTYKSLTKFLYKKGLTSKAGKMLPFQTIQKMLHNPLYAGLLVVEDWGINMKGKHEPLITEELYFTCQGSGRTHKGSKKIEKNPEFPLRRLVVCKWCEKPLTGSFSTGRHGKKYPYYHHHKHDCPHALSIKKNDMEESFVSFLKEINPSFEFANAFKEACMEIYRDDHKRTKEHNDTAEQTIKKLEEKKQGIFDAYEDGIYTKTDFLNRKREVERQISAISLQQVDSQNPNDFEQALEYCMSFVTKTPETWEQLANQPENRLRFQNFIFEGNISYTQNDGFGTAILSPIYSVYQHWLTDKSSLVSL